MSTLTFRRGMWVWYVGGREAFEGKGGSSGASAV